MEYRNKTNFTEKQLERNKNLGLLNQKHGFAHKEELYNVWKAMRGRCNDVNDKSYHNYGGRGISVCDEWRNYAIFREWAYSNGYSNVKKPSGKNLLSIERVDVNGNYEPSNCRWASDIEQARNKQNTVNYKNYIKNNKVKVVEISKSVICPTCNKEFKIKQSSNQKCCSYKCAAVQQSIRLKKQYKDLHKKTCPVCHKIFEDKSGHFKDRVYCGRKCKNFSLSPIWEFNGEKLRVIEWAEKLSINAHCLLHRKELGWDIEKILTTPLRFTKRSKNGL